MGKVLMEITMSLDGYITGPEVSAEAPMGHDGERLHEWMFAGKSVTDIVAFQTTLFGGVGAVIMGRWMVDLGIGLWGEEPPYHAPCFVLTHRPAETIVKKGGTSYVFVTEGIDAAMARAREAAGAQDVMVEGGADIDRQFLNAGLIDEIRLHVAPIFLGGGTPPVRRRTPGPAAGPEPGDQQPACHAPDLPGRRSCRPGVADESEPERRHRGGDGAGEGSSGRAGGLRIAR